MNVEDWEEFFYKELELFVWYCWNVYQLDVVIALSRFISARQAVEVIEPKGQGITGIYRLDKSFFASTDVAEEAIFDGTFADNEDLIFDPSTDH